MSAQIPSEHDFELLSAYLDGELTAVEREALEKRLSDDNQLRTALHGLQTTSRLLHDLPRLKAPRDFTLDPAIYSRKPIIWWQRSVFLQMSGALGAAASIVLIALALLYGKPEHVQQVEDHAAAPAVVSQQTDAVALAPSETPLILAVETTSTVEESYAADTAQSEGAAAATIVSAAPPGNNAASGVMGGEQGYYYPTETTGFDQQAPSVQYATGDEMGPYGAAGAAAPAAGYPPPTATLKMMGTASPLPPAPAAALEAQPNDAQTNSTQANDGQPNVAQSSSSDGQNEPELPTTANDNGQEVAALKATEEVIPTQEPMMREASTVEAEKDHEGQVKVETRSEGRDYRWLAGFGAVLLIGSLGLILMGRRRHG